MIDVYERLREHLDQMATGYPKTESGVEIKILKQIFTEAEGEWFLKLTPIPEKQEDIARRLGIDPALTEGMLKVMSEKGLIFSQKQDNTILYSSVPFIVGIMEFQLKRMTPELARDITTYFMQGFGKNLQKYKNPVLRTIPINREVAAKWPIAPYDDVVEILETQEIIAVADCVCRKMGEHLGNSCGKPLEACFLFGSHADYYVENGMARYIGAMEARTIIARNLKEAGLVMQPANGRETAGMCMCCGDHCGMLISLRLQKKPAEAVQSNYFAEVDEAACKGCKICMDRCQIDAVIIWEEKARINLNRCIGCGTCIPTCQTQALELIRKPEEQLYTPPKDFFDVYMEIAKERGLTG